MVEAPHSLRAFGVIWIGQLVSLVGTGMTQFALLIWVWEKAGAATPFALIAVLSGIATVLSKLFAGTLVDRWNRRRVMAVADLIAGLCSLVIFMLYVTQQLEIWHLYITSSIVGVAGTFQGLAYSTSLTLMIPKAQYARASGLISLGHYASLVGAPLLGGLLLSLIGIGGILLVDLFTFLFAISTLLTVHIPQPAASTSEQPLSLWRNSLLGYQYIFQRRALVELMLIALVFSFAESLAFPLITPMILARTGSNELVLGTVRAMQGVGGIVGGLILVAWGGPKRRIHGVLVGMILTGLFGDMLMGLGSTLPLWIMAALGLELFIPLMLGSYHAIWQSKIDPSMQGRVFAARDLIATVGEPLAKLSTGLLVDNVFGPAMTAGGSLVPFFGGILGTGLGAGMALVMVFGGLFTAGAGLLGYLLKEVRELETLLPDQSV
jgi:MFS transporter, DHA3 family, macrolide efflux protein